MRDAFFVASRGQFISRVHVQLNINSLQNFGFSEHPRKLPKALTRVITEIDVPIGKTARSQYVDFHTSCESPDKNRVENAPCVFLIRKTGTTIQQLEPMNIEILVMIIVNQVDGVGDSTTHFNVLKKCIKTVFKNVLLNHKI